LFKEKIRFIEKFRDLQFIASASAQFGGHLRGTFVCPQTVHTIFKLPSSL